MKITCTSTNPLKVFVAADHGELQPLDDSRLAASALVQEVHYFRAAERRLFLRQLRSFDQTVHVFRKHSSEVAAETFMLDITNSAVIQGLIEFEMKSGASLARRYLRNGVIMLVSAWVTGRATEHIYRIMGGKIWTTPT
jgi:hypothetical protein